MPLVRSVTAMTTITPPIAPCVMKVLAPLSTQPSPRGASPSSACRRHRCRRRPRSAPRRRAPRRDAAAGSAASAPRCRTWRCAPSRGRCARRPTARSPDRPAPAPRCRCSSRPPTCRRRRTPRELDAHQPERRQLRQQIHRELLRLVPLHDVRPRVRVCEHERGRQSGGAEAADLHVQQPRCRSRFRSPGCSSTPRPEAADIVKRCSRLSETHVGYNIGGGVKMAARRAARCGYGSTIGCSHLKGEPRHTNPQRFYAGINLKF